MAVLTVVSTVLLGVGVVTTPSAGAQSEAPSPFIVTFAAGTPTAERDAILAGAGATITSSVPQLRMYAADAPASAADLLRADPRVEGVEADRTREVEGNPDDPAYADQWALPKIGWDQAFGTVQPTGSATVAVLDTGVDATADLAANLVPGASMLAGADSTADPNGHGTAMAGIVAARADNGVGTAGVGYAGVSVMPVQVLGADGTGQDSDIVAGVVYAADHGADVILMSFSNPGRSDALQAAVDYAWSKGAVLVAATGNDGSATPTYPAGAAKVVGVSATTQDDALWSGSNFGAGTFLGAPGVDIATGSGALTGTSTSAAIVAGAAALVKASAPSASNGIVVGRLARTADPAGTADQTGNGRVNLARALADSNTGAVVPQGVEGNGGPIVGPYVAAAFGAVLEGKSAPGLAATPWISGNLAGWAELQQIPVRVRLTGGPAANQQVRVDMPRQKVSGSTVVPGFLSLHSFAAPAGTTFTTPVLTGVGTDTWHYTFNVTVTGATGEVTFLTSMRAGAHNFTGSQLALNGTPSLGSLQIAKPAAGAGSPDLALTKSGLTAVSPGQVMTYTVTYRNLASAPNNATGVQLSDTLPAGTTYVAGSCTGGCTHDPVSNSLNWSLGSVAAASPLVTLTYQVTVGSSVANNTTLVNSAQIFSAENDPNVANNVASVTTTVFTAPSISGRVVDDQDGDGAADAGEPNLAGATITLHRDANGNGTLEGTDPQVGSPVVTTSSGEWAFTGLLKNTGYLVVRTNPATYTSTNAIPETTAVATDHSTATKTSNDQLRVVFDNVAGSTSSLGNLFLAWVAQQNQTITFPQPTTPAVYGSTFLVDPTASSGLPVTLVATGGCSITPASPGWTVTMTSGTTACELTASQAGNSSWHPAPDVTRTVVASKKQLLINAAPKTKAYGAGDPAATYSLTGFVLGDTEASLTGDASCSIAAHSENVGSYPGTYSCAQGTLSSADYSFATGSAGTLTITPASQTITFVQPATPAVYGSTFTVSPTATSGLAVTLVASGGCSISPIVGGWSVTMTSGTASCVLTASQGGDGNYDAAVDVERTVAASKKQLLVNADSHTKVFGAIDPAASYTLTGFVGDDEAGTSVIAGVPACSIAGGHPESVGVHAEVYSCTPNTLTAPNYSFAAGATGSLTITPADQTITFVQPATPATYGNTFTVTPTASSGLPVSLAPSGGCSIVPASPGWTVTMTSGTADCVLTASQGGNASYNAATDVTRTVVAAKRALLINADSKTKSYGADDPAGTYSLGGFAFSQTQASATTGEADCTIAAHDEDAGSYPNTYSCTIGSLEAANYTFAPGAQGTLTITQKQLLVNANDRTKVYGQSDPAPAYTLSGFVAPDTADSSGITGTPVCSGPTAHAQDVGTYAGRYSCGVGTLSSQNYSFAEGAQGALTITPKQLTINAANKSKTYGETDPSASYSLAGFEYDDTQASATTGDAACSIASHPEDVGTYPGTYSCTVGTLESTNYTFVAGSTGSLTIGRAALSVTADANDATAAVDHFTKVYGSANPAFTVRYDGFVGGDDADDLGGTLSFDTTATASSPVGPYPVTPKGLTSGNYTITFVAGTLDVTKAPLTVTADANDATAVVDHFTKVYGSANPAFTVRYDGFVAGDDAGDLGGTLAYDTTATASSPVGPYPVTPKGLTSGNYTITFVAGTLDVTKATLTVTADADDATAAVDHFTKVYGAANPTFTVRYDGFVAGDDADDLGGTLGFDTLATATSDVGPYDVTPKGLTSDNYTITFVAGTLDVTKVALSVVADANPETDPAAEHFTKVYGAANPTFTVRYDGFVAGDDADDLGGTLGFDTTATATSDVGPYDVTPKGLTSDNYTISFVTGTLDVTKATLTVTADADDATAAVDHFTKTYGSANPAFSVRYDGFVAGDDAVDLGGTLAYDTTATASSPVGPYPVTPMGLTSGNYTITFVAGTLDVTKAALSVVADANPATAPAAEHFTKVYGAANPTFTVRYDGFVAGDDADDLGGTLGFDTLATATSDVGPYDVTPKGLTSGNYTISFVTGTLDVTKAALSVVADANPATDPAAEHFTKVYGAANPTFTVRYDGFVAGDDASDLGGTLGFDTLATATSNVDDYAVTPNGLTSGNYTITFVAGTLDVTKAALSVVADANPATGPAAEHFTKVYGAANPTFTVRYDGFVAGDDATDLGGTLGFDTLATTASDVDDYAVTPNGLTSGNYTITFVAGTLDVTKAPLTVTADADDATAVVDHFTKVYGSANPAFTVRYDGFVAGDDAADLGGTLAYDTTATASSPVGPYPVTPKGLTSDNYSITFVAGTLDVTKKELLVNALDRTKVYGQADPAPSYSLTGFVAPDTAGTSGITGAPSCAIAPHGQDAGVYSDVYSCNVGSLLSQNYSFAAGGKGSLTITQAVLNVDAPSHSKTYGAGDPAATYALSGFVNGDVSGTVITTGSPVCSIAPHLEAVGSYPNTYSCLPGTLASLNYSFVAGSKGTLTITPLMPTTQVTVTPGSAQYSDQVTLSATVAPTLVGGSQLAGSVLFSVAGEPAIAAVPINSLGQASVTIKLGGQVTPVGAASVAKTVTATFTSTNPNYGGSVGTTSLSETREDAKIDYTGDGLKMTASATTNTAQVNLSAVVREATDGSIGDKLGTTMLKFTVYKYTDTTFTTPVGTCTTLPLAPAGSGVANGGCSLVLAVDNYTVKIELLGNGYYVAPVENVVVTVALPGTGFTTGGGWLTEPDLQTRSNFGFTVKYLKKGQIQGNSLYIYRRTLAPNQIANPAGGFLPAGDYNWIIKSNAMEQLTQACTTTLPKICTATFTGKSNVTAVNRATGVAYSLGGNRQFQVNVTDKGEPGASSSTTPDTYAIRVWDTSGTYYQLGSPTAQVALNGGNIQVRP